MNDIVDAVKDKENQEAVKNYFQQVWSDFKDNSWKTNLTIGLIVLILAIF